jgi:hypothetical protein
VTQLLQNGVGHHALRGWRARRQTPQRPIHAVENTLKHHALDAPNNLAERDSFDHLRLLRSYRGFASSFHSLRRPPLKNKNTRYGSPTLTPIVKSLHTSAPLRGASPPSLRTGFAPRRALGICDPRALQLRRDFVSSCPFLVRAGEAQRLVFG